MDDSVDDKMILAEIFNRVSQGFQAQIHAQEDMMPFQRKRVFQLVSQFRHQHPGYRGQNRQHQPGNKSQIASPYFSLELSAFWHCWIIHPGLLFLQESLCNLYRFFRCGCRPQPVHGLYLVFFRFKRVNGDNVPRGIISA